MPRKSQSANVDNVSSDTNTVSNELVQQLLAKISDLENRLDAKQESAKSESKQESYEFDDADEFNKIKIDQDSYIKVVSLTPFMLNLTTEGKGRGKRFVFRSFGETKRILYSDLVKILENHHNFVEEFYFYIMDKRVIRRHGLDSLYETALTKEKIEAIITGNSNDAVSLFKSCNEHQQSVIVDLLIEKIQNNPESVDLNMVDKISRASGIKIQERAEERKSLMQIITNPEDEEVKQINK